MSGILVEELARKELVKPPGHVLGGRIQYLCMMGSVAYGCSDVGSDIDIYGWCIPNKEIIFPHMRGIIHGFDPVDQKFEQWQQHHTHDRQAQKEYDFSVYNITKYFRLCMDNNPNMIDSLFVPQRCILHSTRVANMVRDQRDVFLHKGAWHKFKGYAYSQLHKMNNKQTFELAALEREYGLVHTPSEEIKQIMEKEFRDWDTGWDGDKGDSPKGMDLQRLLKLRKALENSARLDNVRKYGYDVKFAYHLVRLLEEVRQILVEHTIDLERNREQLKAIRRGNWTIDQVNEWASAEEKNLEKVYAESTLRHVPDKNAIKTLLMNCLEEHYGTIDDAVKVLNKHQQAIDDIKEIIERYRL